VEEIKGEGEELEGWTITAAELEVFIPRRLVL